MLCVSRYLMFTFLLLIYNVFHFNILYAKCSNQSYNILMDHTVIYSEPGDRYKVQGLQQPRYTLPTATEGYDSATPPTLPPCHKGMRWGTRRQVALDHTGSRRRLSRSHTVLRTTRSTTVAPNVPVAVLRLNYYDCSTSIPIYLCTLSVYLTPYQ